MAELLENRSRTPYYKLTDADLENIARTDNNLADLRKRRRKSQDGLMRRLAKKIDLAGNVVFKSSEGKERAEFDEEFLRSQQDPNLEYLRDYWFKSGALFREAKSIAVNLREQATAQFGPSSLGIAGPFLEQDPEKSNNPPELPTTVFKRYPLATRSPKPKPEIPIALRPSSKGEIIFPEPFGLGPSSKSRVQPPTADGGHKLRITTQEPTQQEDLDEDLDEELDEEDLDAGPNPEAGDDNHAQAAAQIVEEPEVVSPQSLVEPDLVTSANLTARSFSRGDLTSLLGIETESKQAAEPDPDPISSLTELEHDIQLLLPGMRRLTLEEVPETIGMTVGSAQEVPTPAETKPAILPLEVAEELPIRELAAAIRAGKARVEPVSAVLKDPLSPPTTAQILRKGARNFRNLAYTAVGVAAGIAGVVLVAYVIAAGIGQPSDSEAQGSSPVPTADLSSRRTQIAEFAASPKPSETPTPKPSVSPTRTPIPPTATIRVTATLPTGREIVATLTAPAVLPTRLPESTETATPPPSQPVLSEAGRQALRLSTEYLNTLPIPSSTVPLIQDQQPLGGEITEGSAGTDAEKTERTESLPATGGAIPGEIPGPMRAGAGFLIAGLFERMRDRLIKRKVKSA